MENPEGPDDSHSASSESDEDRFDASKPGRSTNATSDEDDEQGDSAVREAEERLKALKAEEQRRAEEADLAAQQLKALKAANKAKNKKKKYPSIAAMEVETGSLPERRRHPPQGGRNSKCLLITVFVLVLLLTVLVVALFISQLAGSDPAVAPASEAAAAISTGGSSGGDGDSQAFLAALNLTLSAQLQAISDALRLKAATTLVETLNQAVDSNQQVVETQLDSLDEHLDLSDLALAAVASNLTSSFNSLDDSLLQVKSNLETQLDSLDEHLDLSDLAFAAVASNLTSSLGALEELVLTKAKEQALATQAAAHSIQQLFNMSTSIQQAIADLQAANANVSNQINFVTQQVSVLNNVTTGSPGSGSSGPTQELLVNITRQLSELTAAQSGSTEPKIASITYALEVRLLGGDVITLAGSNFDKAPLSITVNGQYVCQVLASGAELVTCVFPRLPRAPSGSATVRVTTAAGFSEGSVFVVAPQLLNNHASSLSSTANIDQCTPFPVHRSGGRLTITGDHFLDEGEFPFDQPPAAEVQIGDQGGLQLDCVVRSASRTAIVCDYPSEPFPVPASNKLHNVSVFWHGTVNAPDLVVPDVTFEGKRLINWAQSYRDCGNGCSSVTYKSTCGEVKLACCGSWLDIYRCSTGNSCNGVIGNYLTPVAVPYPGGVEWKVACTTGPYFLGLDNLYTIETGSNGCNTASAPDGTLVSVSTNDRLAVVRMGPDSVEYRKNGVVFATNNPLTQKPGSGDMFGSFTGLTEEAHGWSKVTDSEYIHAFIPGDYIR